LVALTISSPLKLFATLGGKVKKNSRQAARDKTIDNVIASLRIENLAPSETVVQGLHDCLTGKDYKELISQSTEPTCQSTTRLIAELD